MKHPIQEYNDEDIRSIKGANKITAIRIRKALKKKNMSQQDLARLSGVAKSSISQYVNGTFSPSNITSTKMAPILEETPMYLMGFDETPEEKELLNSSFIEDYTNQRKYRYETERYLEKEINDCHKNLDRILKSRYREEFLEKFNEYVKNIDIDDKIKELEKERPDIKNSRD